MSRRLRLGWRVAKHGALTISGVEYYAEQLEAYNGQKVYVTERFDKTDSAKSIGFAAFVSNAAGRHIVSVNWDGEVVEPGPRIPFRCAVKDGLCLCHGGKAVLCESGREINEGRREVLESFSKR